MNRGFYISLEEFTVPYKFVEMLIIFKCVLFQI